MFCFFFLKRFEVAYVAEHNILRSCLDPAGLNLTNV
jgi:hypothetical protein